MDDDRSQAFHEVRIFGYDFIERQVIDMSEEKYHVSPFALGGVNPVKQYFSGDCWLAV